MATVMSIGRVGLTSSLYVTTAPKTPSTTAANNVFGDVFIAEFPFTSGTISKPRPVLILFDLDADVVLCRITSVARSGVLDVALIDWQQAGLLLPSVARLDRLVTADRAILRRRLGQLTISDRERIRMRWNAHMRL